MKQPTRVFFLGILFLLLSGCSQLQQLDTKSKVLGGALATAAVIEATEGTNYGITHGVISYGVSHAAETFADQAFYHPEDEWIADTVAIIGAAVPAAYYVDKESGDSDDSKADYLFPLGNFLYTAWDRLSHEQHPPFEALPLLNQQIPVETRDVAIQPDTTLTIF